MLRVLLLIRIFHIFFDQLNDYTEAKMQVTLLVLSTFILNLQSVIQQQCSVITVRRDSVGKPSQRPSYTLLFCEHHLPRVLQLLQKSPVQVRLFKSVSLQYCTYVHQPVGGTGELTSHPKEQRSKQLCFSQTRLDFCLRALENE